LKEDSRGSRWKNKEMAKQVSIREDSVPEDSLDSGDSVEKLKSVKPKCIFFIINFYREGEEEQVECVGWSKLRIRLEVATVGEEQGEC